MTKRSDGQLGFDVLRLDSVTAPDLVKAPDDDLTARHYDRDEAEQLKHDVMKFIEVSHLLRVARIDRLRLEIIVAVSARVKVEKCNVKYGKYVSN